MMPILPLTDGDGVLREDAPLWLLAIMHFPRSTERQQELYAASWARMITSREPTPEKLTSSMEAVELLANAKPFEMQLKDVRAQHIRGYLVGEVLALICFHAQSDPKSASRNKAQYLQREYLDAAAGAYPGIRLPRSERSQHDNWREFSSVAHLWAGFVLLSQWGSAVLDGAGSRILGFKHEETLQLLEFAEYFRTIGEEFEPSGQRPTADSPSKTVLNSEETWRIPDDLHLSEIDIAFTPSDEMSSLLNTYNYAKLYDIK